MRLELSRLKNLYNIEDIDIESHLIEDIEIPDATSWINNNTILTKTLVKQGNKDVYNLSRENKSASYTAITDNKVNYGRNYETSIIVKKGDLGSFFGLRVSGVYPNRVEAVFDLEKGHVKGTNTGGDFENVNAKIRPLGEGWFYCTVSGKIRTNNVKIVLGPTTNDIKVDAWEGVTDKSCDVYIIPSSLIIEESPQ
jgi:hypothetical protein